MKNLGNQQNLCEIIEILKCDITKLLEVYCKIEKFTGETLQTKSVNLSCHDKNRMLCAIIRVLESNDSIFHEIYRQIRKSTVIRRDHLTADEHLNILAQPKVSVIDPLTSQLIHHHLLSTQKKLSYFNVKLKKCSSRQNRMRQRQLSSTRLKRLATPNLLRALLTFDEHFHHLNIFQIENFLKLIYERDYQTPSEFVKSLRKKSRSLRRDKDSCERLRGLEGFSVIEHDECDEWKSDEQCYSLIDFYPRNDQQQTITKKSDLSAVNVVAESTIKEAETKTKRDSEISFLRPSQINIAKSDCEKIFKKLKVFHALKMERQDKKGQGEFNDDDTKVDIKSEKFKSNALKLKKEARKVKKTKQESDDDEPESVIKVEKSQKRKNKGRTDTDEKVSEDENDEEIEEEDDSEEDLDELQNEPHKHGGNICANFIAKTPEWNVEWRG